MSAPVQVLPRSVTARRVGIALAWVCGLSGALGLTVPGWALLGTWVPGAAAMHPTVVLCVLLAASLLLLWQWRPQGRGVQLLSALVAGVLLSVGISIVWTDVSGADNFYHDLWIAGRGRVSLASAIALLVLGVGLVPWPARSVGAWVGPVAAVTLLFIGLSSLLAIAFDPLTTRVGELALRRISPVSAVAFVALGWALTLQMAARGYLALLVSPHAGGLTARRVLLLAFTLPPLVIAFSLWLSRLLGEPDALLFAAPLLTAAALILLWRYLLRLDESDRQLRDLQAELGASNEELRAANEELEAANEELYTANEELTTANDALQHSNQELALAHQRIRELSAAALHRSEMRFAELLASIPDVFVAFDQELRYVYWNAAAEAWAGIPLREALGRTMWEIFPGSEATEMGIALRAVQHSRQPQTLRLVRPHPRTGQDEWFEVQVNPFDEGISVLSRNITEQMRYEAQLNASRNHFERLVNTIPDQFVLLDAELRHVYWNRPASEFLQLPFEAVQGRCFTEVFPQPAAAAAAEVMREVIRTGQVRNLRAPSLVPERAAWFDVAIFPYLDGVAVLSRDVSPQVAYEAELSRARDAAEEASRAKTFFLANMSHEIRTPINGILGITSLLEQTLEHEAQYRHPLSLLRQSGERLLHTLGGILSISKVEAGKTANTLGPVPLHTVTANQVMLLKPLADRQGLRLQLQLPPEPMHIQGDEQLLRQVLNNLVGNAIKYTEQGSVTVRVLPGSAPPAATDAPPPNGPPDSAAGSPPANWVELRIEDTGIGISDDFLRHRLFEPFEQESRGYGRKFEGTGLGLYITNRLVQAMGGHLQLHSQVGQGTTCIVSLRQTEQQT